MPAVAPAPDARIASPLRWAGGKRWLRPVIDDLVRGVDIANYHEPFLGGASVFLGLPEFGKSYLRDTNKELIETFRVIRDDPETLAELVAAFENDEATYYDLRASKPVTKLDRAARFIYLNHTSFNGIYRVNLQGVYNVPFGNRNSPQVPSAEHLRTVSKRLKKARLDVGDFEASLKRVERSDLVFLDPPYTVAHNHNGFVKYNQRLFSFGDQRRLRKLIDEINDRDAFYILTNAAHESIKTLFSNGDRLMETNRRNSIGGVNAVRGRATEYLFTNLPTP